MTETPVLLGPDSALFGVLAQPVCHNPASIAFLMFNAGVLSRIGPHRLNVKIARSLALTGETSLRFDLAGQGDSRNATAKGDYRAQAVLDIRCAMDFLERTHGIRRFALIGICSGAVNAYATALADSRVVGVLMFDGYWYRSRWTLPIRHWKHFQATSLSHAMAALWRRLIGPLSESANGRSAGVFDGNETPPNPPRAEFARSLKVLADRSVFTYLMYSGSVRDYYSYTNQFRDVFGRETFFNEVRCDFLPDVDHTFLSLHAQRRMIESVQAWASEIRCGGNAADGDGPFPVEPGLLATPQGIQQ